MLVTNCDFHVGHMIPDVYTGLTVTETDNHQSKVSLMDIIDNWVNAKGATRAIDDPAIDNPACPEHTHPYMD